MNKEKNDPVNHPSHYTNHPSGVECVDITEHMNFCLGNAIKYIWRADLKDDAIQDLEKAVFYIKREIDRRKKTSKKVVDRLTVYDKKQYTDPPERYSEPEIPWPTLS